MMGVIGASTLIRRGLGITAGLDAGLARDLAVRCDDLAYHSLWSNDEPGAPGLETLAHFTDAPPPLRRGRGRGGAQLLDTYGQERRPVAQQVLAFTEAFVRFGTAPRSAQRTLRDALLPACDSPSPNAVSRAESPRRHAPTRPAR